MRKMLKKLVTIATAGALTAGALSLVACGYSFDPLGGNYSAGTPVSNGGFVVEKGEYVYFINGVETYTADNEYGTPVKGSLMRIAKSDVTARATANEDGETKAETVVPSLMVASDYTSGIYIFGDRVYYATPNNVENTTGSIQNDYLDFRSARLDGSDVQFYFNVSSNSTVYRFVQPDENGSVYLVYVQDSELHSYNTQKKEDVLLAKNVGGYVLNSTDKTDPYVYYTMSVTSNIDAPSGAVTRDYNQIYRVRADATETPYDTLKNYAWKQDYLDDNDGEPPYINCGEIVLDGIGSAFTNTPTVFTHDLTDGVTPASYTGFTYSLQAYTNGGIYFTRSEIAKTDSVGEDAGWLYYLSADSLASGWNSISGNRSLDIVAQSTTNAGTAAIFYLDEQGHHYVYVNGSNMFRADVGKDSNGIAKETLIARGVSGATLMYLDTTSDSQYDYVYYTMSGSSGNNIWRAVSNGTEEDYKVLGYEDAKYYTPVQILDIEHARSWYNFEIVDGMLYFADARAVGSTSYNYLSYLPLTKNGKLMDNVQLADLNKKFEAVMGGDEDGILDTLTSDGNTKLSTAIRYYFLTGHIEQFDQNIADAVEAGKKQNYLYSEEDQSEFLLFAAGDGRAKGLVDEDGKSYRTLDYFVTKLGKMTDADSDAIDEYWKTTLEHYEAPTDTETAGIPGWAWALIGVGIGLVIVGLGVIVFVVLKKRKDEGEPEEDKMYVDTTDDRSVDVYSDAPAESEESGEEPAESGELGEEPAESEESGEEPAEDAEHEEN